MAAESCLIVSCPGQLLARRASGDHHQIGLVLFNDTKEVCPLDADDVAKLRRVLQFVRGDSERRFVNLAQDMLRINAFVLHGQGGGCDAVADADADHLHFASSGSLAELVLELCLLRVAVDTSPPENQVSLPARFSMR